MIEVCETRDVALLRGMLESDRVGGAYLLGDLEAPFFDSGTWLVATRGSSPAIASVLVFAGAEEPVVLSFGEAQGVEAIVACAGPKVRGSESPKVSSLPESCYLKVAPAHEPAFARAFEILERDEMKVMALNRRDYRSGAGGYDVRRLDTSFPVQQIFDVYRSYPGHFFTPGQLAANIYFGSFEGERLVAVAGTHVYSPAGRVACLGNIVTTSDKRGRGHGGACTSAVIDELYERGCETIALHVAAANAPAQACYRRLGFHEHGPILQMRAKRHNAGSAVAAT